MRTHVDAFIYEMTLKSITALMSCKLPLVSKCNYPKLLSNLQGGCWV